MKVAMIGVGKLGKSCAEMMAQRHEVVGYDIRPVSPTNFKMASSLREAVESAEIVFIAVETPHDPAYDGSAPTSHLPPKDFDYTVVESVIKDINKCANSSQTIVLISTVLPGTIRSKLAPLIEHSDLIYNPYLIAMGTVKWDMINPEMVMIGAEDSDSPKNKKLVDFYKTIIANDPRYIIGTWEEMECLKVFYNTFISAKISLVNMIQDVAERLGHINSELVCDALANSDRRIMGPAYMKPGMGDGGACHPRDNIALRELAKRLELGYDIFDAVMLSREKQAENLAKFLMKFGMPIIVVGKTYKPLVEYLNGSYSMLVGAYLAKHGAEFFYLDHNVNEVPPKNLGPTVFLLAHSPEITYGRQLDEVKIFYEENLSQAHEHSAVIDNYDIAWQSYLRPGAVVVDPWRKQREIEEVSVIHYGNTRNRSLGSSNFRY